MECRDRSGQLALQGSQLEFAGANPDLLLQDADPGRRFPSYPPRLCRARALLECDEDRRLDETRR